MVKRRDHIWKWEADSARSSAIFDYNRKISLGLGQTSKRKCRYKYSELGLAVPEKIFKLIYNTTSGRNTQNLQFAILVPTGRSVLLVASRRKYPSNKLRPLATLLILQAWLKKRIIIFLDNLKKKSQFTTRRKYVKLPFGVQIVHFLPEIFGWSGLKVSQFNTIWIGRPKRFVPVISRILLPRPDGFT